MTYFGNGSGEEKGPENIREEENAKANQRRFFREGEIAAAGTLPGFSAFDFEVME